MFSWITRVVLRAQTYASNSSSLIEVSPIVCIWAGSQVGWSVGKLVHRCGLVYRWPGGIMAHGKLKWICHQTCMYCTSVDTPTGKSTLHRQVVMYHLSPLRIHWKVVPVDMHMTVTVQQWFASSWLHRQWFCITSFLTTIWMWTIHELYAHGLKLPGLHKDIFTSSFYSNFCINESNKSTSQASY